MTPENRADFEVLLGDLCAGFNVPSSSRLEAYWQGLEKMPLAMFGRVVKFALGENGPEKIPTAPQCWRISHALRTSYQAPQPPANVDERAADFEPWDMVANRHLHEEVKSMAALGHFSGTEYRGHGVDLVLSASGVRTMATLRSWSAEWARTMKLADDDERADGGMELWRNCMKRAREEIEARV